MYTFNYSPVLADSLQMRALQNTQLISFSEKANRAIQADPFEGFRACAPLLEDLCCSAAFTNLVNYELHRLLNQPGYAMLGSSAENLLVSISPHFTLVLRIVSMSTGQDRLYGQACDTILAPVQSSVMVSRYHQSKPFPSDVLDRSRRLTYEGETTLSSGQSAFFAACEDIFLINAPLPETTPPILAILITPYRFQIRWEYDPVTLSPVRAIAADNSASRLEFVISSMASMNDRNALPVLLELSSSHPAHFVRWAAVQAMFRLDPEVGMQALHRSLRDSHEHVREAAKRSLDRFAGSVEVKTSMPVYSKS